MATYVTTALRAALGAAGSDVGELVHCFQRWKSGGMMAEYHEYLFGKDSAYVTPLVNGRRNVLRHVHLVPLASPAQLQQWNKDWRKRRRKISDRALVYADNGRGDYLLIHILNDPGAHETARMRTARDRALMESLAKVADLFIHSDHVP